MPLKPAIEMRRAACALLPLLCCGLCALGLGARGRPDAPIAIPARPLLVPAALRLGSRTPGALPGVLRDADARGNVDWRPDAGAAAGHAPLEEARVELDPRGDPRRIELRAVAAGADAPAQWVFERRSDPLAGSAAFESSDGWMGRAQWCATGKSGARVRVQARRGAAEMCAELELTPR